MPVYAEKYAICALCWNVQNTQQLHVRIKLTCLLNILFSFRKYKIVIVFCNFKILFHHYYIVCCYVARDCAHLQLSGRLAVCQPVLSVLKYDWTIVKQSTIRDLLQVARVQLLSSLYRPPVTDKSSTSNYWCALALLVKPDCKSQHGWRYWLLLKSAVDWYLETALLLPPENNVELESGLGCKGTAFLHVWLLVNSVPAPPSSQKCVFTISDH